VSWIARAGRSQSINPSVFAIRGASVTSASSCGVSVAVPAASAGSVEARRDAPISASRASSPAPVSSGSIGVRATASIAPASSALTTRMIVTPVSASPSMIARSIGDAPRQRGSSDAWTLTRPRRGSDSTGSGSRRPYAATTPSSGSNAAIASRNDASPSFVGCSTARPADSARAFTGDAETCRPRPRGLSGCVTTPTTVAWGEASRASSVGTAKAGVPKNSTRSGITTFPCAGAGGSAARSAAG